MLLSGFLVVFAGVLAFANGNRCNNKTDIELYDPSDHSKFQCWKALDCHDGQEPSVEPGSTHPKGTDLHCVRCHDDFFSNRETNYRCRKCTTCGNKVVRSPCTIFRDRLCENLCVSKKFYFNYTDHQCYPCTECCGANNTNIEPQCLSSGHIGSMIGGKGALHCKVLSSQKCDEPPKMNGSLIATNASVVNNTSGLEKKCHGTENSNSSNSNSSVLEKKCSWSWDTLHILLICGLACMALIIVVLFLLLQKERKMRASESCHARINNCYSSSAGCICRQGDCDRTRLLGATPFQERLSVIPEGVKIDRIPYQVKNLIMKLDAKKRLCKNWYDVGCKLEMSEDVLDLIKREDDREGGSPTSSLLTKLTTWQTVISLREFVEVLNDLERNDIINPIIEFYERRATNNETSV